MNPLSHKVHRVGTGLAAKVGESRKVAISLPIAIGLTSTSVLLYGAMMALFLRTLLARRRPKVGRPTCAPRVSVLKPLAGTDDDLDDNLESFARLEYPSFELLLGIADRSDAALGVARRFAGRHPELDVQIVMTDPSAALNPKVAQLIGLERLATGEIYVISDSNVRVTPTYLWSLVEELEDFRVGIVTSLFCGAGERTIGAALENLQICASTAPGYAAMDVVSRKPLTVGKSMAVRRKDLAALGGFAPIGNVLAEDHLLGRRFMDAGFTSKLADEIVENRNASGSIRKTIERHTRWAKTRRSVIPYAFYVEWVLTPTIVATGCLMLAPSKTMAALYLVVCAGQTWCAFFGARLIRGFPLAWKYAPLEIVRSYIAFFCWIRACFSRRIAWRGHAFVLHSGSTIVPTDRAAHRTTGRARLAA